MDLDSRAENIVQINKDELADRAFEYHFHPVPIITVVDESRLPLLRELIGSIHYFRSDNLDVPFVTVYGVDLTGKSRREIQMWRNVELVDVMENVFLGSKSVLSTSTLSEKSIASNSTIELSKAGNLQWLVRTIVNLTLRKHGSAIFIDTSLRFSQGGKGGGTGKGLFAQLEKNVLHNPDGVVVFRFDDSSKGPGEVVEPFGFATMPLAFALRADTAFAKFMVDIPLQCIRGYQCPASVQPAVAQQQMTLLEKFSRPAKDVGLTKQGNKNKSMFWARQKNKSTFCYVLLRDDILYSEALLELLSQPDRKSTSMPSVLPPVSLNKENQPRRRIALLTPTFTVPDLNHLKDVSPIRILVPSILNTISDDEISRFEIVLYFGFDEGDRYWDDPSTLQRIDAHLKEMINVLNRGIAVHFRYIRIPFSKGWVTYIWNSLFVQAYHDDCDYFVQVNDDAEFQSPKWMTVLTEPLTRVSENFPTGFGVSGPKDRKHGNTLLFTQSVVSRLHYEIFGRLYPLDIKDWFSDDWITNVYGPDGTFQATDSWIRNWNEDGTRYNVCSEPRYPEVLERSKAVVEKFVDGWRRERQGLPKTTNGTNEVDEAGVLVLVQK